MNAISVILTRFTQSNKLNEMFNDIIQYDINAMDFLQFVASMLADKEFVKINIFKKELKKISNNINDKKYHLFSYFSQLQLCKYIRKM